MKRWTLEDGADAAAAADADAVCRSIRFDPGREGGEESLQAKQSGLLTFQLLNVWPFSSILSLCMSSETPGT